MRLLEDLSSGKYNIVLFGILFIFMFHQYWCTSRSTRQSWSKHTKEPMADVSVDIKEAVKQVYLADVEAIRNLSEVATKLQKEGLKIPGNLTVDGSFNYLPKGTIVAYNQTSAPAGWAICDGNNQTPDLRGRFVLGNGGSRGINATGGEENVTLGVHQMPQHQHNVNGDTDTKGNHNHGFKVGGGGGGRGGGNGTTEGYTNHGGGFDTNTYDNGNHTHNFNVNSSYVGGNQPHNNMPPFYVLTYIMKL